MSAASRSPRTMPTPSMSPRPATSLPTIGPTCSAPTDSGRTWQSITGNFPDQRDHPRDSRGSGPPGLLFVGTETGIYFSLDDGKTWMRMRGGLPVVPVYDLKIKDDDLVAGTHGRSFWILDDITPLRALADGSAVSRLIPPRETVRTKLHFGSMAGVRGPFASQSLPASGVASRHMSCPTAPGAANISMSARTHPMARSSTIG